MSSQFQKIIEGDKPVLVDFSAEWCGPCKAMAPILKELKSRVGDNIIILKVDVDSNPGISQSMNITGVPTLVLFQKGQVKWRQSGVVPLHQLETIVRQ